jgi:arylformamidase
MSKKYAFLGYPLSAQTPTPPAIPAPAFSPFMALEKDGANVTMMQFASHTGTHLDVPKHVVAGAASLSDLQPVDFIFESPLVIDLPLEDAAVVQADDLTPFVTAGQEADFLLFRFGYGEIREKDPERFTTKSPGFGVESARFLRDNFPAMRGMGMDVPSLSCIEYLDETMAAHNVLLEGPGKHFIIVEDMKLDLDLHGLTQVIVAPLLAADLDGGPCTVIGIFD